MTSRPPSTPGAGEASFAQESDRFAAADRWLCGLIEQWSRSVPPPFLVGLSGPQGSGKSHSAERLRCLLEDRGHRVLVLSLDDFYLTKCERLGLANAVHPLLATRGVPGTHDIALLCATLDRLAGAGPRTRTDLPRFSKAEDDRMPVGEHAHWLGRPRIVILEGWCIGAMPQQRAELVRPVNGLEAIEDRSGHWRAFVNCALGGPYAGLAARLHKLIALRAPGFEVVRRWRSQQEACLRLASPGAPGVMEEGALCRFMAHYERLTRAMLADPVGDVIVELADDRSPLSGTLRAPRHPIRRTSGPRRGRRVAMRAHRARAPSGSRVPDGQASE